MMKTCKNYLLLVFVLALTAFGCWLGKDQLMSHDLSTSNVVLCQAKGNVVAVMRSSGMTVTFYTNRKAKINDGYRTYNGNWQTIKSRAGKKGIWFWSNSMDGSAILYCNYMISLGSDGEEFDSRSGMIYYGPENVYYTLESRMRGSSKASVKWYRGI